MVVCFIALFVFGFLAIFSAKYRPFAKEAFNCVFKRMTLRKCDTGFDKKLKAKITGKLMRKNLKFGSFIYRYFEAISWGFTAVLVFSLVFSAIAIYNIAVYQNCNGPGSTYCPVTGTTGVECPQVQQCDNPACDCQVGGQCICPDNESCKGGS
jgi:hypothetical protein